jgi:O-acetyl-ADP-ribose deacetylase (regulator of RNase III)
MGQDLRTDASKIQLATRNALNIADEKNIPSISFPALGTGVGGFSAFHCAKIMITEAIGFLMTSRKVNLVRFVLFDQPTLDAFEQELKLQFSSKRHQG